MISRRTLLFAVRGVVGACELGCARRVAHLVRAPDMASPTPMVIQVLGARQIVQAVATQLRTTPAVLASGATVDGLHAASMVAVALTKPQWRRAALAEALLAICLAVTDVSAARAIESRRQRPAPASLSRVQFAGRQWGSGTGAGREYVHG